MKNLDHLEGNASFSKKSPGLQILYDTVSTGYLKECARKYELAIVDGWTPKKQSVHLFFGLITHSAREAYDNATIKDGGDHDAGIRAAVLHCLEAAGSRRDVLICKECGAVNEPAAKIGVEKVTLNDSKGEFKGVLDMWVCLACNSTDLKLKRDHFFPWESDDKNKNLRTLIRTMVWYFDHYEDDPAKTIKLASGEPAVELWFRFELDLHSKNGEQFVLTGHLDRLVEFSKKNWFADLKTTKNTINQNYFEQFTPDNQMYFYLVGSKIVFKDEIAGGIIDAAQVAIHFSKFQRGMIQLTSGQMEEWLKDIKIWIKQAESYAEAGYWPMNDKACHHYGGCPFRGVCNKDPKSRTAYLKTSFVQRNWDPSVKRGI